MISERSRGYVLGAIAAASYGLNPLFALPLYGAGLGVDSVLFYRYVLAVVMLGALMLFRRQSFALRRRDVLPLAAMGVLFSVSSLLLFESYNLMDAGIASTILFVYPILVALIMAVAFKEKVTLQTALCILLALCGIGLLYRNGDGSTLNLTGTIMVFASALSYALYIVGINRKVLQNVATLKVTFYILLSGLTLFFVRLDFGEHITVPDQWYLWGNLLALAIFPTAISFLCTTSAIQYIGSTPTAILGALEPVTAVFFGVAVFGEPLTPRIGCGIAMIILAVTLIIAGGNITTYMIRFRKLFPKLPIRKP